MDVNVERECSALGGLFNQIITDMKNGTPLWEDLISKATKLHACLRAAILAVSAYLEAFQKIADAATNARGATKEIGTALTRICLRHKAVETRMKSFTSAIMDRLVMPLQEKLEDWKKSLINLDKEHTKEYKKAKSELKKRSTDTLRLQKKKARKGIVQGHGHNQMVNLQSQGNRIDYVELNRLLESSEASVQEKRLSLEETERKAVRAALLEERGRFCQLAKFLKPVLDEEILMLMELTHLQEVSDQLERHAASPFDLPAASEQVITDLKGRETTKWTLATPPSSPSLSLGSRKSSMCSISSLNSSSSGSCKNHPSTCTHPWHRSMSQPIGTRPSSIAGTGTVLRHLSNGCSRDSGFTSQDTLYRQPITEHQVSSVSSPSNQTNCPTKSSTNATWPDLQETSVLERQGQTSTVNERPHTISSAYEKGHQRPALSVYTFQAPDPGCCHSQPASPVSSPSSNPQLARVQMRKNSAGNLRPPIPSRCSSLERPTATGKNEGTGTNRGKPKLPLPAHLAKELGNHQQQPMYVNMHELASLAANRAQEMQIPMASTGVAASVPGATCGRQPPNNSSEKSETPAAEKDAGSATSESSLESSSGYGSQSTLPTSQSVTNQSEATVVPSGSCTIPRRGSIQQTRPPPPTRRTSTIIGGNYSTSGSIIGVTGGLLAATVLNTDDRSEPIATSDETENLPPPPAFLLEGNSPIPSPTPQRSISVSETVRTLTELRHTPASPSFLRKAANQAAQQTQGSLTQITTRCTFVERSNSSRRVSTTSLESSSSSSVSSGQFQGPGGVGQGFIAVLSSKLINTTSNVNSSGSPKSTRKHINVETNSSSRTPVGFLETLNAKLAAQQQQVQQTQLLQNPPQIQHPPQVIQTQAVRSNTTNRSASVRRIMANRVPIIDPLQVRDSLMDQIRRGTSLRKTSGPINDRSAPQIY